MTNPATESSIPYQDTLRGYPGAGNATALPLEGRHYSCRASSGGSVVLVNQTTEPIASLDVAQG